MDPPCAQGVIGGKEGDEDDRDEEWSENGSKAGNLSENGSEAGSQEGGEEGGEEATDMVLESPDGSDGEDLAPESHDEYAGDELLPGQTGFGVSIVGLMSGEILTYAGTHIGDEAKGWAKGVWPSGFGVADVSDGTQFRGQFEGLNLHGLGEITSIVGQPALARGVFDGTTRQSLTCGEVFMSLEDGSPRPVGGWDKEDKEWAERLDAALKSADEAQVRGRAAREQHRVQSSVVQGEGSGAAQVARVALEAHVTRQLRFILPVGKHKYADRYEAALVAEPYDSNEFDKARAKALHAVACELRAAEKLIAEHLEAGGYPWSESRVLPTAELRKNTFAVVGMATALCNRERLAVTAYLAHARRLELEGRLQSANAAELIAEHTIVARRHKYDAPVGPGAGASCDRGKRLSTAARKTEGAKAMVRQSKQNRLRAELEAAKETVASKQAALDAMESGSGGEAGTVAGRIQQRRASAVPAARDSPADGKGGGREGGSGGDSGDGTDVE